MSIIPLIIFAIPVIITLIVLFKSLSNVSDFDFCGFKPVISKLRDQIQEDRRVLDSQQKTVDSLSESVELLPVLIELIASDDSFKTKPEDINIQSLMDKLS